MIRMPRDFKPLVGNLSASFRRPQTACRLVFFFAAAIVVAGDRTVSAVIQLLAIIEPISPSTFHTVFAPTLVESATGSRDRTICHRSVLPRWDHSSLWLRNRRRLSRQKRLRESQAS
jgi:hypothetical protein